MASPTYPWSIISSTQTDANSPINETLMEGIRQDLIHLKEWLGENYTPAVDHNHDGVNSSFVASVADGSINTCKIKS